MAHLTSVQSQLVRPASVPSQTAHPRFGAGEPAVKPEGKTDDKVDLSSTQNTGEAKKQRKNPEQKRQSDRQQAQNFFQTLSRRIEKFIKDITKAIQHLFGKEKPKSELKQHLKQYAENVQMLTESKPLRKAVKATGETLEEILPTSPLPAEEKAEIETLAQNLQTRKGQAQYIENNFTLPVALLNSTVESENAPHAVKLELKALEHYVRTGKKPEDPSEFAPLYAEVFNQTTDTPEASKTENKKTDS